MRRKDRWGKEAELADRAMTPVAPGVMPGSLEWASAVGNQAVARLAASQQLAPAAVPEDGEMDEVTTEAPSEEPAQATEGPAETAAPTEDAPGEDAMDASGEDAMEAEAPAGEGSFAAEGVPSAEGGEELAVE